MFTNIVQQKYINIKLLCVKYIVRQNNIVSLTKRPDEGVCCDLRLRWRALILMHLASQLIDVNVYRYRDKLGKEEASAHFPCKDRHLLLTFPFIWGPIRMMSNH